MLKQFIVMDFLSISSLSLCCMTGLLRHLVEMGNGIVAKCSVRLSLGAGSATIFKHVVHQTHWGRC